MSGGIVYTPPAAEPPAATQVGTQQLVTIETANLAANAEEGDSISMHPSFVVQRLQVNVPARIRLYGTTAYRDADQARPIGEDPVGDHGVILDYVAEAGGGPWFLNPEPVGCNADVGEPTWDIFYLVQNLDAVARTISVPIVYLALQDRW